jgi:hypothetical protein
MPDHAQLITGSWEFAGGGPCSRVYPRRIEFKEGGLYSGTGAELSAEIPGWDTGTWRVLEAGQVRISTTNDAYVTYRFSLEDNRLTFVDPFGCEFTYQRLH